jgi:hypothetical protein
VSECVSVSVCVCVCVWWGASFYTPLHCVLASEAPGSASFLIGVWVGPASSLRCHTAHKHPGCVLDQPGLPGQSC